MHFPILTAALLLGSTALATPVFPRANAHDIDPRCDGHEDCPPPPPPPCVPHHLNCKVECEKEDDKYCKDACDGNPEKPTCEDYDSKKKAEEAARKKAEHEKEEHEKEEHEKWRKQHEKEEYEKWHKEHEKEEYEKWQKDHKKEEAAKKKEEWIEECLEEYEENECHHMMI